LLSACCYSISLIIWFFRFEKKLTKQDIADILRYRECAGSSSEDSAKEKQRWNEVAARVIIDGLEANGCPESEIFSSNTPLMKIVVRCLTGKTNLETLSKKRKRGNFSGRLGIDAIGNDLGQNSEIADDYQDVQGMYFHVVFMFPNPLI
jgi:hypothetical protein